MCAILQKSLGALHITVIACLSVFQVQAAAPSGLWFAISKHPPPPDSESLKQTLG